MTRPGGPWNHNSHYHQLIIGHLPPGCAQVLDVGCGTGAFTRELRRSAPEVTGIDADERSIDAASSHPDASDIKYLCSDFFAFPFEPATFDLVSAVASLHHMDVEKALARMAWLLRPGGLLAVIGLARKGSVFDYALDPLGFLDDRMHRFAGALRDRGRPLKSGAEESYVPPPVWPPSHTYREMRRVAGALLPGAQYHRHLLWRYSLLWIKP